MSALDRIRSVRMWIPAALLCGVAAAVASARHSAVVAEPPPAYELVPMPAGLDSLTPLADLAQEAGGCARQCSSVVYVWSPRMPLSRMGIPHVVEAAARLGVRLTLVGSEELYEYADGVASGRVDRLPLAESMLGAGVLAHAPAITVLDGTRVVGPAILGYKASAAYEALVARRLKGGAAGVVAGAELAAGPPPPEARVRADFEAVGVPGAYFRWVPGKRAVAYESGQRIYLLDLTDGTNLVAPGFVDFVPTPDGRYFVTPGPGPGGLTFYSADEVFEAARALRSGVVEPIFVDLRMRDQYPSVGILESGSARTVYRVMTSWFEGLVYRDYEVRVDPDTGTSSVQPVGRPTVPCVGYALSTPIMSQTGREVAARDEASGTTKIFQMLEDGTCKEVVDLGVPTSKVAWHPSGRRVAFATPRRRGSPGDEGIFVYDRDDDRVMRVPESEGASRLAFPEWVGDASVIFLVPGRSRSDVSYFRIVDGVD